LSCACLDKQDSSWVCSSLEWGVLVSSTNLIRQNWPHFPIKPLPQTWLPEGVFLCPDRGLNTPLFIPGTILFCLFQSVCPVAYVGSVPRLQWAQIKLR
jgi:hypothetical protein